MFSFSFMFQLKLKKVTMSGLLKTKRLSRVSLLTGTKNRTLNYIYNIQFNDIIRLN